MMTPKQETYYILDYPAVDKLIQEHFNKPDYSCIPEEEWGNDSVHRIMVRLDWYLESDREDVRHFINDTKPYESWSCSLNSLMDELAERQIIPEGDYLVEVCW